MLTARAGRKGAWHAMASKNFRITVAAFAVSMSFVLLELSYAQTPPGREWIARCQEKHVGKHAPRRRLYADSGAIWKVVRPGSGQPKSEQPRIGGDDGARIIRARTSLHRRFPV